MLRTTPRQIVGDTGVDCSSITSAKIYAYTSLGIANRIIVLRGQRSCSAVICRPYQVEPRALIQAVRKNPEHFPADFMFALTKDEFGR
jgi:hypothetical protein